MTKRTTIRVITTISAIFLTAILVIVWLYGPIVGALLFARPVFIVTTPHRYATLAFDYAESQGIYSDTPEFKQVREKAEAELAHVHSIEETHPLIESVLKAAGGKHSGLISPEDNVAATTENSEMPSVTSQGDIVTVRLPSVGRGPVTQEYADTAAEGLAKTMPNACGAIVDLRGNDGGDMGPMIAGISSLLPDGVILTFKGKFTSDVTVSGSSVAGGGSPITARSDRKFNKPVAILTDNETASSAEATLLAFRGLENTKSFGKPTAGYASANVVLDMPDGAALRLTISKDVARTGEEFAEDPIVPDIETDEPEIAAAEWLQQQCG
ncbi:S41 family peptidase [Corynebacterium freiburgense]|uniref:S41 family peptidase n=1 Tax=Corynebacterium freiburgense TaxID=556548 RepID=UPI00040335F9|nr:S41 family peptidase [Corynebacterium freiburgense]WJZ03498.1 Carboxy-terminal processing protease CtpA precursor [Corynebacterium freiburgense]